jgi:hypothetical protein
LARGDTEANGTPRGEIEVAFPQLDAPRRGRLARSASGVHENHVSKALRGSGRIHASGNEDTAPRTMQFGWFVGVAADPQRGVRAAFRWPMAHRNTTGSGGGCMWSEVQRGICVEVLARNLEAVLQKQ